MQQLIQELKNVLITEKFPVPGWELRFERTPVLHSHVFELFDRLPEVDEDGVVVRKSPPVGEVIASEVRAIAEFRVPQNCSLEISGKTILLPRSCYEKQYVTIHQPERGLNIHIDFQCVAQYQAVTVMPDYESFRNKTAEWAGKMAREDPRAKLVLLQLKNFQENGNRALRRVLQNLVNVVRDSEPEYFNWLEMLMRGHCTAEDIHRQCVSRGRQVVVVEEGRYAPMLVN